jgi:hypothetical protein
MRSALVGSQLSRVRPLWSVQNENFSVSSQNDMLLPESTLVAAVAAQLFVFFKADLDSQDSEENKTMSRRAVVILSYAAITLSISATISSLILTDEFSEMRTRAARSTWVHGDAETFYGKQWKLLIEYGLHKRAAWVVWHCKCLHFSPIAVEHCNHSSPRAHISADVLHMCSGISGGVCRKPTGCSR